MKLLDYLKFKNLFDTKLKIEELNLLFVINSRNLLDTKLKVQKPELKV